MYERITLPNGARIVCEHMDAVRSASLGIWVGAGSRYEKYSEAGSAHFIEHMLFKGTSQYTAAQLAERMDAVGGQMNAYTTRDNTCFYARVLDTHLSLATDTLCAMFFDSRFDEADVENEKGIIQEEIDMYEDTPEDVAAERLIGGCFPGALGRPVLGRSSSLARQTGESLRDFMSRHYAAPRVVAALSGSFSDADVEELARRFSAMPAAKPKKPERSAYRPCLTVRRKATEQNQLVLGFPGLETASGERFAMQLLSGILGRQRLLAPLPDPGARSTGSATRSIPSRRALRTRASSPSPRRRTADTEARALARHNGRAAPPPGRGRHRGRSSPGPGSR